MRILVVFVFLLILFLNVSAQAKKVTVSPVDGTLVVGYVDNGAFVNFGGPNIVYTNKESKLFIGMLPSIRIKKDKGTYKNSTLFPSLGMGLTYTYKALALQLPLYYNPKTPTSNGKWNLGFGFGLRLNKL